MVLVRLLFPIAGFDFHPELMAHVIALGLSPFTSFWGHKRYSFAQSKDVSEGLRAFGELLWSVKRHQLTDEQGSVRSMSGPGLDYELR